jgi:four helix bundle protein
MVNDVLAFDFIVNIEMLVLITLPQNRSISGSFLRALNLIMQNYKDLKVWAKAHQLTLKVYLLSKGFPKEELYSLTNQLRRSISAIPANIAEGCGKHSQKDLGNYLNIALGSANEAEYFLLLSRDLEYLTLDEHDDLNDNINEIKAMLISLFSKVRNKI